MDTTELHQCCERVFGSDRSTTVVLVTAFKVGDPLVLSEPVTDLTVAAPADLFLVKLVVGPGNPGPPGAPSTSPGIGIEVWLPPKPVWNRRIHNIGGLGGYDGGDHSSPTQVGWFYAALTAGNEGAVSASTDSGHTPRDGTWAMNPDRTTATQLWTDFAHRAMHEMAVKTKALATAFYGSQPSYSYYEGSSTGGRHGYRLAQQYPEDYDGIVANLPTVNFTEWSLSNLHRRLIAQRDLDGVDLTEEQMDLVSNAAINACDVVGREHLGYIFDNESCHYDPTTDPDVLCVSDGGSSVSPHCVTKAQAMAINKMWYGPTRDGSAPDPAVDNGVGTDLNGRSWYGLTRGTSLYVAYFAKRDPRMREVLRAASSNGNAAGSDQAALVRRDPAMAGPSFQNESGNGQAGWRDLTYQQLADTFELGVEMEQAFAGIASNDADLSRFKERGGKFLSWHGWNDESIPVQTTMRYYDRVVETMGGLEEVQAFYKLYLVPGGGHMSPHGTSNEDANPPAVAPGQFYRLIVDWVENGVEPGRVEIKSPASTPAPITQPIFPYPQKAVYAGGDPRISSSYIGS